MHFPRLSILITALALSLGACGQSDPPPDASPQYDTLIRGGTVVDGTGNPGYVADIAIKGGLIARIGDMDDATAARIIDAQGKIVAPGFIDVHSHADDQQGAWRGMRSPDPQRRAAPAHVTQGITTAVVNSDGLSPTMPLAEQINAVEKNDFALNLVYMSPLARVRYAVLGADSARPATPEEIERMKEELRADMDAGGWGLSTVLEMRDGRYTTTQELIGLTSALREYDGVFIAHLRSQGQKPGWWTPSLHEGRETDYPPAPTMFGAAQEMIEIAKANGIRVSMSHISMRGPDPDKNVVKTVAAVNAAWQEGAGVYADMHVYRANPLGVFGGMIPFWAAVTGPPSPTFHIRPNDPHRMIDFQTPLAQTMEDEEKAERVRRDAAYLIEHWGGAEEIYITDYPDADFIGKSVAELAADLGMTPVDVAIKLALEGYSHYIGGAVAYGNFRQPENIELLIQQPWTAGDTDGYTTRPGDPGYLHPRFYGAYPAWIRTYVLEKGSVSLEFAIRSFTGVAADIVGLEDRGLLKEGYAADLSVIDLANVRPNATFYDIHRFSDGFDHVLINGEPVVSNGELTWALPGQVIKRVDREGTAP